MPTPVSYLSGASLSNTVGMFKRGTIAQNLKTSLESGYRWWNGVEVTSSQYLIYSDTFTLGTTTQANATPVAYSTPDLTDQSLLNLINTLPPRIGQTAFTSLPIALQWLQSSNKFFLIRGGTENIVKSNLKLYVDAGRYDSYIGNGTTWSDLSGNNNNGTLVNGTGYNSSGVGSMVFDGSDDYVNCGNGITTTNQITVSAWVKLNVNNIFQHIVDSANNTWHLAVLSDGRIYFWDGNVYHTNGDILSTGKWYHVVGVKTTTTNDVYVNGILSSSLNSNVSISTNNVWIGRWQPTGDGRAFNGNISNVQIYDTALTPQQILQNFNAQKYRFGYYDYVQDGLVLNLDATNYLSYPRSGTTWTDLTGRGNNGTLTNGPTFSGGTTPSIVFDGANDYVRAPFETILNDCTIEVWFNANSIKIYQYLLSIGRTDTNEYSFYLDMNDTDYGSLAQTMWVYWNSGGSLNSLVPKTGSNVIGGTSYGDWNDSTWRCYIFTRSVTDSPYTKHYMNGLEVTNVTRQNDQTTKFGNGAGYQITLGAYRSNNLNFPGNQSIVRIYNKVLSPQEVIQNFESQRVNYGITGITTNGLVLNLDAANTASYNGSGTTWVDISGSEFDGTLINGPTYGNSGATSNILLDGIDDFISGNTLTNLMNGSTTLTLIIWIYPTNLNNTGAGGSGYKTLVDTPGRHLSLWLGTNGQGQFYGIGGTTNSYGTNFNWENNKWQMVTIIANSSDGQIIKNNYDVSQTVGKGNTFTQQITFGNNPSTGGSNLEGRYGSIQLYNRALSVAEVSQNYNAQKSRFGL